MPIYIGEYSVGGMSNGDNDIKAVTLGSYGTFGYSSGSYPDIVGSIMTPVTADTNGNVQNPTMHMPRWKGYVDENNGGNMWICAYGTNPDVVYTTDSGSTWNDTNIDLVGDYHISVWGVNGDLYTTGPTVAAQYISGNTSSDVSTTSPLVDTTPTHRSCTCVDGNGRWWVFTRDTGTAGENVRYHYSDNSGATWTDALAYECNNDAAGVRIGCFPLEDGTVMLNILYLSDNRQYEYLKWTGTEFSGYSDQSVYSGNSQLIRQYTWNHVGDYLHMIHNSGDTLLHTWKAHNGGTGSWTASPITTTYNNQSLNPCSVVRGNKLYMFYSMGTGDDLDDSWAIYGNIWSQTEESWGGEFLVYSGNGLQSYPNTSPKIPTDANYVPVFWSEGSGTSWNTLYSRLNLV